MTLQARIIAALALALTAFAGGCWLGGALAGAEAARLQTAWAEERASLADARAAAAARALDFERAGNELAARLAATETARLTAAAETQNALKKATTGRACLTADAVRLLNAPAAASAPVPAPARRAPPADAGIATDYDIARWASNARAQYDNCRARLDAIRKWSEQVN